MKKRRLKHRSLNDALRMTTKVVDPAGLSAPIAQTLDREARAMLEALVHYALEEPDGGPCPWREGPMHAPDEQPCPLCEGAGRLRVVLRPIASPTGKNFQSLL